MTFEVSSWVEEAEHESAVVRNESEGIQARGIGGLKGGRPNFVGTGRCREGNGGVRRGKRNELREGFRCLHCWKPVWKSNVENVQYFTMQIISFPLPNSHTQMVSSKVGRSGFNCRS
jgi:hypothetical protein